MKDATFLALVAFFEVVAFLDDASLDVAGFVALTIGVFLGVALVGAVLAFGAAAFFVAVVFFTLGTTAALALVAAGAVFLLVAGFLGADLGVLPCIQMERRPKDAVNVRF